MHWKRNAAFFIAGQFLSMFGSMLVSYAITWSVTVKEQSGVVVALFTCAAMLPMVFVSPFAGVWADRYNRKYLINISDASIAVVTLIVAVVYSLGFRDIWILLLSVVVRSIGQGVQSPAVSALIPQIVPEEHLARFNGIQGTLQSLISFAAPMAALALLNFLPIEQIFFIDVATAALGIAAVFFFVKVGKVENAAKRAPGIKSYLDDMKEGLRYIGGQPWLKILFAGMALFLVFASPAAMLTPLQVTRTFGSDYWRLSAIEITFSVGMMLGGVAISVWGGFKNKTHSIILACILFGFTSLLLGLIPNFWVYLAVMALCGMSMPLFNTPSMTLMQLKIPPQLMGRVFSLMMVINGLGMPFGMAIFGPLGDAVKIETLLVITGAVIVTGGFFIFRQKEFIKAGEEE